MGQMQTGPGRHMAAEIAEAPGVFARAASADHSGRLARLGLDRATAFYTVARGSSDAAAAMLAYEAMRELGRPVTSLPPSVFSIGDGVQMEGKAAFILSQSGASEDLVRTARGIAARGGRTVALTNQPGSAVEQAAGATIAVGAGPERAVPATKTVIGTLGAAMALIAALRPDYSPRAEASAQAMARLAGVTHPAADSIRAALLRLPHVYVVGRDTGFGAAQEVALKIKETCAIHAEAYSASEVLHGPLQLVTRPLLVLILDTEFDVARASLDQAQTRFDEAGGTVIRISPSDVGAAGLTPLAAAAALLYLLYPVILSTAVTLGIDPDAPSTLSKVTQTR